MQAMAQAIPPEVEAAFSDNLLLLRGGKEAANSAEGVARVTDPYEGLLCGPAAAAAALPGGVVPPGLWFSVCTLSPIRTCGRCDENTNSSSQWQGGREGERGTWHAGVPSVADWRLLGKAKQALSGVSGAVEGDFAIPVLASPYLTHQRVPLGRTQDGPSSPA